jgi:23S rRNA pseudouridine1911/1915/1917 synthase
MESTHLLCTEPASSIDEEAVPLSLPEGKPLEFTIKHKAAAQRLDQFLVSALPGHSRSEIKKAIDAGAVTVNDLQAKASYRVRASDHIRLTRPEPLHGPPAAEDIPLEILYQDDCLAVINKPADMVVHPAKGNWSGTLVNALRFHFRELSGLNGEYRPGIVHRLDRDTSGVILVAKDEHSHRELSMQFELRQVFKEYVAIVQGVLDRDSDYIERAIGPHPREHDKMATYDRANDLAIKDACTFYEVIERFQGYTFCRAYPRTGRTHQIRVHLAHVGCPVLADKAYGSRNRLLLSDLLPDLDPERDTVLMPRQALHARRIRFHHPRTRAIIEAEARLPVEFERTLQALREHRRPS